MPRPVSRTSTTQPPPAQRAVDVDAAAGGRRVDRVPHQVVERLAQLRRVDDDASGRGDVRA